MTPSVVLITNRVLLVPVPQREETRACDWGTKDVHVHLPHHEIATVCQKDMYFSLPSHHQRHNTSPDDVHELTERSRSSQQLYALHSPGNSLTQGATPAESKCMPSWKRAGGSVSHILVNTPTGEPSTRKSIFLRKHWLNWAFTTSTAKPYHSICSGYKS